jgi:hypothetical protein
MINNRTHAAIAIALALALFVSTDARAAVGDGVCVAGSQEATSSQCANLGPFVLEAVPNAGEFPVVGTCQVNNAPVACAFWAYRFSGPSGTDNQLNILIPAALDVYVNQLYAPTNTTFIGCQQLYAPGAGDPTTGFGKGIITYKTCRLALNFDAGPGTPNLVLATALSSPGALPVQEKSGKSIYFEDILGPFTAGVPRLATTSQEITTKNGAVLTVDINRTGQFVGATSTHGPVTIVPPGNAILCTPTSPTNTFPTNFPGGYDCAPIVENLDGTNLQAGEDPTCYYRLSNGTLLKYAC